MGGGGGNNDAANAAFWAEKKQLDDQANQASIVSAEATRQQLSGTQLDWLRQFGQSTAMKQAGIGAPFSGASGGFQTTLLTPAGGLIPPSRAAVALGAPR